MSSDLWAAFGSPQDTDKAENANASQHSVQSSRKSDDEKWETDSWSAVNEALESAWSGQPKLEPFSQSVAASHPAANSSSLPATVEGEDDFGDFEEPEDGTLTLPISHEPVTSLPQQNVPESLAEDVDDFGDFAEAESGGDTHQEPFPSNEHGNLRSLKATPQKQPPLAQKTAHTEDFNALIDFVASDPTVSSTATPQAPGSATAERKTAGKKEIPILQAESDSDHNDDDWDDGWEDLGSPLTGRKAAPANSQKAPAKNVAKKESNQGTSFSAGRMPPPTNIPPPSVLIYLISTLIPKLPEKIRITIVETFEDGEADVTKHTDTILVAARILAGRKLRWKRDTILAQSMKMGLAGRQGGMKLAGVDRAEMQREDREATELVRIWRQHLGSIRTALAEASNAASKPKPLPAVTESAVVRTAKADEGGIVAPRCCVLCGLKRDERVDKVDREVWDQFGEWWTDHWGHRACQAFWTGHAARLQQR